MRSRFTAMNLPALFIISFILGCAGAWIASLWGPALGVVDRANHRSSHDGIVPKGGGIGILAAFVFAAVSHDFSPLFWAPAAFVALFSLYGDRVDVSPEFRLSVQFVAALATMAGVSYSFFHPAQDLWSFKYGLYILFFSVFITGTANYYNFMDGINGIAGITGVVGFWLVAVFSKLSGGNEALSMLALCIGFSCLGFLPFNMLKARVFMGDVGSVLLGFLFALFVVSFSGGLNDFFVLCAFLFPFYADELTTSFVRLRDRENLLKAHRRHVYQLLANEMAIPHWKVSAGYGGLQAFVGLSALGIRGHGTPALVLFLICCFAGFWVLGRMIRKRTESSV